MVTVQVEFDDELYKDLKEQADRMGQPDVLIRAAVARASRDGHTVSEEFLADVRRVIEDYRPVLRRLAQ